MRGRLAETVSLANARCGCGCATVFAVRPGQDPERRGAVDLFTRRDPLVEAGAPDAFFCAPCWMDRFAVRTEAAD